MTSLSDLLKSSDALLLDFDGPICRLFAGYPADAVASEVRDFLSRKGVQVPQQHQGPDPLKLFQWSASAYPELSALTEARLISAECTAAHTAEPTAGSRELITAASRHRVPVAIVSNNSGEAIQVYLSTHDLADAVSTVVGRPPGHPERMKPRPDLLNLAMQKLSVTPGRSIFVGDAMTDVEAARLGGVACIGYAKDSTRVTGLLEAGADAVVESMAEVVQALGA